MHIPRVPLRFYLMAIAVLLPIFTVWVVVLWQPERQVERHMENLLKRASNRNWNAVGRMISADYSDAWGIEKERALRELQEVFRHYFAVDLYAADPPHIQVGDGKGSAEAVIRVKGNGTAVAEFVTQEVNSLQGPFTFRWERAGSMPWKWHLVRVEHATFDPKRRFY